MDKTVWKARKSILCCKRVEASACYVRHKGPKFLST